MLIDAQCAVAAVVSLRVVEIRVEGPVADDVRAARSGVVRCVGGGVQLLVGGFEGGGEARILD